MTEQRGRFPTSSRAAIVAALFALICVVTTVAGAAPPSKEEVKRAKDRLERIEDELARIRDRLAATQLELHEKAAEVEENQIELEEIQADLQRTRAKLDRAEARYETITERLNERAVEAYMQGPASGIDFVLGAETVAELTDRLAYADALAQADAELAVDVANLKNELTVLQTMLEDDRERQARVVARSREEEEDLLALFGQIQDLQDRRQDLFVDVRRFFRNQKADRQEWLEEQQAQGGGVGGRVWNGGPLPEPYDGVLERCPVEQPRGFGDGFGAPRYGGGYHLHKGVDIVAPLGTKIIAPFDGYSYTSSNGLGGNVVFVVGRYGRAYNAHLSSYSANSNGRVVAGELIGYVGSTGGYSTVPHDHFEFHPNTIPSPWPASVPYGYSVIEDAINPYPLLIQACG
jgi:murein DD-endopeptidase MepM/ murein hydrolase activator NlpD